MSSSQSNDPAEKRTGIRDVTGVILLGGKSTRYGKNKAFVEVCGIPLIERVVSAMRSVFEHVMLVTNDPREYAYLELPMVEDLIKGLGPIGGVYTGLKTVPGKAGFFVACDMPFLNTSLIRHMVASKAGYDVVVPKIDWMIEPLHALYTKKCIPAIKKLIDTGQLQIIKFLSEVNTLYVDEAQIRAFDPHLKCFLNINKPKDLPMT
ncbi:MAG: molybdenum cofactor guanylyltransferase [Deltaproteobacteria bacterium]|nr:molybdenum cofactor guanylyltransferase [Deltaproteobacteria bacterium]MBW2044250.1 molybdenum cofactor guanylyltransferase [Deltaproteobacteria bacterium]MBW2300752.1 molybdenum cofactor guanylyltransferase [Deltaproteobacteria bacterium]